MSAETARICHAAEDGGRHAWREVIHLDGCHHWRSAYRCDCGAARDIGGERENRPYPSPMANLEACDRCRELADGARRRPAWDWFLPAGADPDSGWRRTHKEDL